MWTRGARGWMLMSMFGRSLASRLLDGEAFGGWVAETGMGRVADGSRQHHRQHQSTDDTAPPTPKPTLRMRLACHLLTGFGEVQQESAD